MSINVQPKITDPNRPNQITTGKGRVNFPALFEPKQFAPTDTPKYSMQLIFDKNDTVNIQALNAARDEAIRIGMADPNIWAGKTPQELIAMGFRWQPALKDGDQHMNKKRMTNNVASGYEEYENKIFVMAKSQMQVGVYDVAKQPILTDGAVYSGCYARASITFAPFKNGDMIGITVYLNLVQKLEDGEKLGGGITAATAFDDIDMGDIPSTPGLPGQSPYPPMQPQYPQQPAAPMQPQYPQQPAAPMQPQYPQQPAAPMQPNGTPYMTPPTAGNSFLG